MHRFLERVLDYQVADKSIVEQEKEVYKYAYIILAEECINLLIAVAIGIAFGKITLVVSFLCAYIPIRMFAGGYHADNGVKCSFVSAIVLITLCIIVNFDISEGGFWIRCTLLVASEIGIFFLAPIDSENKRLSDTEKKKYCKIVRKILAIQVAIAFGGIAIKNKQIPAGIFWAHIVLNRFNRCDFAFQYG